MTSARSSGRCRSSREALTTAVPARLRERRGLSDRQTANDWLAFLRALGLARETSRGFVRTDAEPTPERVREGLRDGVLLVPEALTAPERRLARGPAYPRRTVCGDPRVGPAARPRPRPELGGDVARARRSAPRWLALVDLAEEIEAG